MPFDSEIDANAQVRIDLERAREYIRQGWCQGALEDEQGNVCIYGALYKAVTGEADWVKRNESGDNRIIAAAKVLETLTPPYSPTSKYHQSVVTFNNATTTTQADVINLLDQAIMKVETL